MNDGIRIRFSIGLIFVAVIHALLLGVVFNALHSRSPLQPTERPWSPAIYQSVAPTTTKIEKLDQPQSVNLHAQGEIKQQRPAVCPPYCPPSRVVVQPTIVHPTVVQPVVIPQQPSILPAPSFTPIPETAPMIGPAVLTPAAAPASPPPKKNYQLALFVGNDTKSKQLQQWFEQDAGLVKLRGSCEYQVYTANNAIYRARFADIVPADQFPVVLFQDSTGGHVHAAGRSMIPDTAAELYSDLRRGFELYQQAKQAQKTGAVKTRGYSWDEAITPTMSLSSQDCPDGYCPAEPTDSWRPGDRVRDLLFNDKLDPRNALMWLSAGEIATLALIIIAAILIGFILIKRGI
jgi:hypothetical protein